MKRIDNGGVAGSGYRIAVRRIAQTSFLAFTVPISIYSQQIASKDLLRPTVVDSTPTQIEESHEYPDECSKKVGEGGFRDGVTLPEDKVPRQISVRLVEINGTKLAMGSEVVATAKLQNLGRKSIQIPWSTDFRTTMNGQNPDVRSWEFAEFRMSLRYRKNPHYFDQLVTTSQPLYASRFVAGSYLTLKPGEWITARISFRIRVQSPKFEELNIGTTDLALEWFQTGRTRVMKDCGVTLGYFPYDDPFESLNRRVVARVQIERTNATSAPAQ